MIHILYFADKGLHRTDGHCPCRPRVRLAGLLVIHRRIRES